MRWRVLRREGRSGSFVEREVGVSSQGFIGLFGFYIFVIAIYTIVFIS